MKIDKESVYEGSGILRFDDGTYIDFYHCPDCCEWNYADFTQIDDLAFQATFDPDKFHIEITRDHGFRFGDSPQNMYFVPCYSEQNGYYSTDLEIRLHRATQVYNVECGYPW